MKPYLLIAFCLICFASPAKAQALHGEDLLEECKAAITINDHPNSSPSQAAAIQYAHCMGYINGMKDGFFFWQTTSDVFKGQMLVAPACIPDEASLIQLVRVVVKYLEDNPQELHQSAAVLVMTSLHKAFPCQSK